MDTYKYDFSVVTAVYNVEKHLREAIESLVKQTIGFEHIQLILVDDGSTDESGNICDQYRKRYPENIIVIHQENGRQASARNAGIPYAEGKYVSFMDPDDSLSSDAMELVKAFMDGDGLEADMCCIPRYFCGNRNDEHPRNQIFLDGTRVVNLLEVEEPEYVALSTSPSFFRLETARKMEFDAELYYKEDAKEALRVLIDNPNIGLVSGGQYNFRRDRNTTKNNSLQYEDTSLLLIKRYFKWIMEYAAEKYGYVPRFVQNAVMYDLVATLKWKEVPATVLADGQEAEYKEELFSTVALMDDDIIMEQSLAQVTKLFLLGKKYGRSPKLKLIRTKNKPIIKEDDTADFKKCGKADILLTYNDEKIIAVSEMRVAWQFLDIDADKKECSIEGQIAVCGLDQYRYKLFVVADGVPYECSTFRIEQRDGAFVGEKVSYRVGFKATLPLKETTRMYVAMSVKDVLVINNEITFGDFFPVTDRYTNAYAFVDGYTITTEKNYIQISTKVGKKERFVRECRFLAEIWRKNLLGGRKSIVSRIVYHTVKPHLRKKLWIVSDRVAKADDNGEALFRYLQEHKPEGVDTIFAVSKDSDDYSRIRKIGKCVDSMSYLHKILFILCDVNISSGAERATINPFDCYSDSIRDLLMSKKTVFLQHGILEKDASSWLYKYNRNLNGIVTSTVRERDSILNGPYYYDEDTVWLTGLPRYDRLHQSENRKITIMPTWRRSLVKKYDKNTGLWEEIDGFEDTDYYKFYDGLLNSEKLLSTLEEYGYTLQFFPHPNMRGFIDCFHHDVRVRYLSTETLYRDVYAESELIATDYSSAVFDFTYLHKPVIYFQFDRDEFFTGGHTMSKGYFDYEEDGFGEVLYDLDSAIDTIIGYVKNGCELKDLYRNRIDSFYAFNDRDNCRRVTEHILKMCEES